MSKPKWLQGETPNELAQSVCSALSLPTGGPAEHFIERAAAEARAAAFETAINLIESGVKCRTCEAVFLGTDAHECERPNYGTASREDIAAAIRRLGGEGR